MTAFGDDERDFGGWYNYHKSEQEMNHDALHMNLKYQCQDIDAFIDIFDQRNKFLEKFDSIKSREKN